ncbi:MAG TPA: methyl-accepting chemotaxis protein [Myxococcales bacterium]|nr:methyl-accepting chemotaxis protein [Myxococcales bacterium]
MRLRIGTRVLLYFACVIGIVVALGVLGFTTMSRLSEELKGSLGEAFSASAELAELRLLARQARLILAASAAAGTTADLKAADELARRFSTRLAELAPHLPPSVAAGELAQSMNLAVSTGREYAQANALQQWNRAGELGPRFSKAGEVLESRLEQAQGDERSWVEGRLATVARRMQVRGIVFAAGIAACLALAALLGLSLQRRLIVPLGTLKTATARIVEHGDLAQTIEVSSKDEIGELAASFARLVEKLREIPVNLHEATETLSNSVGSLSVSAGEQNQAILKQAASLQQTQITANEIRQTSATAAQKADHVLQAIARADEVSRQGEASVERSLSGLSEIGQGVVSLAEKIDALKERMRQIDGINLTVKDLADQSNMLALNAAIEAVRSGEHGKGFAVVAREIRNLADQSIQATVRIREILLDITVSINETAKISATGRQRAESGLAEIRASGETLRALSAMVKDTSDAVRQITASVAQQNAGISQIFTAVSDLSDGMQDTTRQLESTGEAIDRIRTVSDRVSGIVRSYRT